MNNEKTPSTPTRSEKLQKEQDLALRDELVSKGHEPMLERELELYEEGDGTLEQLQDSPAVTRLLIRNARRSAADIEKMTGIPATEVLERLGNLIIDATWRDDLMEERLILLEMGMLLEDIRTRMSRLDVEDEGWASMARVQLSVMKTLLEQLDKRRKAIDGQLALVSKQQAELIVDAIKLNNEVTAAALAKKFGVDEEVVYAEWEENFPKSIAYLESRADK